MSVRNLESLFSPDSIAVFGATNRPEHLGCRVWRNLLNARFHGTLYAVNPKYRELDTHPVYHRARDLPKPPMLALICTPPDSVASVVADLAQTGTKAAVILSSGLSAAHKQAVLAAARPQVLRILGPACSAFLAPHAGLHASASTIGAQAGDLSFVSQSGTVMQAMLDWASVRGIGFAHAVALGEQSDIDEGDLLDYLASDASTRAILLYLHTVTAPRKFMSAARAAARNKPVILVKAGRSAVARAGSPAELGPYPADWVFNAAIERAGLLRVDTLEELFEAAQTLTNLRAHTSTSLTILSNSTAAGCMAADAAAHQCIDLARLPDAARTALGALGICTAPGAIPLDLGADASAQRHSQVLSALQSEPGTGTVLFIHAPSAQQDSAELAQAMVSVTGASQLSERVLSCWLGGPSMDAAQQIFRAAGVADFDTPEQAVRAFSMLVQYRRSQAQLLQSVPARSAASDFDAGLVQTLVRAALQRNEIKPSGQTAQALLQATGLGRLSETPSPAGIADPAQEVVLGTTLDPLWGPVVYFGQGGWAATALADRAVALPPLNAQLAQALIARTRVGRFLSDADTGPTYRTLVLQNALLALAQLLAEVPEFAEFEIRPLSIEAQGLLVHSVRITLDPSGPAGAHHFAIKPYPAEFEEQLQWRGRSLWLRPIKPEDEALHMAFLQSLDPEDIRMRVFYSRRTLERSELARLVQIDYAREMAFVALAQGDNGELETLGVVRAMIDPDNIEAEFGVIVRSGLKGGGLGHLLMCKLITYLRSQGTQKLVATVLDHNTRMLQLAHELGFADVAQGGDLSGTRKIVLALT